MKKDCGIYRWRNLINNKIYIGLSTSLPHRYKQFTRWNSPYSVNFKYGVSPLNADRILYSDIKYWEYTILEHCDESQLAEREVYWIDYYNSTDKQIGYNISPGGNFISEETKCKIRDAQKGRPLTEEHKWALGKPVHQYTKDGVFIREWHSASEAERELSICHVNKACKGQIQSAGGYLWKLASDTTELPVYSPRTNAKPILQCDREGNIIREWKSIREAAQTLNIGDTAISSACKGHFITYKGFVWRYKFDKDCTAPKKMKIHQVVWMDNDGNVIAIYPSARQGSVATGATTTNIMRTCNGIYQTAGGFKWRYATPDEIASLNNS